MTKIYIDDDAENMFGICDSLNELADLIKSKNAGDTIYFINANLTFKGSKRQEQIGIELLIWLRLKGIMNHCVLHSFETIHALLNRNPKNLILTSKGTSFLQMPEVLERVDTTRFNTNVATNENLKLHLKAAFNIHEFRHEEANWWGILVNWKLHQMVNKGFAVSLPSEIIKQNNQLNNAIAKFTYLSKQNIPHNNFDRIHALQLELKQKQPSILHIDDQAKEGWADLFQFMIYGKLNPNKFSSIDILPTDTIKDILQKTKDLICPKTKIKGAFTPDIVLLDVRLFPSKDEKEKDVAKMGGAYILNMIRKEHAGIPVIITSASNKAITYQELIKLGADAYWTKEGLDEGKSMEDSFNNYEKILQLVKHTISEDYALLKVMAEKIKLIKNGVAFWWESKNWTVESIIVKSSHVPLKQTTQVKKADLLKIYSDGVELYREFLSIKLLNTSYEISKGNDWFYYSSIIVHLGKCIELIHNLYSNDYAKYGSFRSVMSCRNDIAGIGLYDDRNAAAHLGKSHHINFNKYKAFILDMNNYLNV